MGLNLRALHDMNDAERAAFHKRLDDGFVERLAEEKAARARQTKPRASKHEPRSKRGDELICMPMVIHGRNRGGVSASTDGSEDKIVFLPFNAGIDVYHPPGGKWAAITMPKWLRNNRKLHTENRPDLPPIKPGVTAADPGYEAYRHTEDGERSAISEHVRWQNEKLAPVACFTRKAHGGSTW